jgi:hypothetical protein
MRTIAYAIVDKETNKRVDWSIDRYRVEDKLSKMADKEKYEIRWKWMSF